MAAIAGIALGAASFATQIFGGASSSKAAKKAAEKARRIGMLNAKGLERQAGDRESRGRETERRHYWAAAQFKGHQFTRITGAGLNANFGSAASIRAQTAMLIVRDASTIRQNTSQDVEQLLHQAALARIGGEAQAAQLRGQGLSALYSGISGAVQTAASTATAFGRLQATAATRPEATPESTATEAFY